MTFVRRHRVTLVLFLLLGVIVALVVLRLREQREAFSSLTFMSILALMRVYMVMASQFRSLQDPFVIMIMFSVPMGFIGVILALFLTRTTLSTTSFMGIIVMVGIVVSNGVLLIEYTNELRRRGLALALEERFPRHLALEETGAA